MLSSFPSAFLILLGFYTWFLLLVLPTLPRAFAVLPLTVRSIDINIVESPSLYTGRLFIGTKSITFFDHSLAVHRHFANQDIFVQISLYIYHYWNIQLSSEIAVFWTLLFSTAYQLCIMRIHYVRWS
ncbi:hypothetical protein CPC08DRAFT_16190 [Agrocybe pediades]|nr:hypothetical protein CPC08DRAFT_16190 [Agrocybe pediades]